MSFFKTEILNERCGVVVDIGSGSVGIAIVISKKETNELQVIWSHREYMLIKDVADQFALLKDINTTLINAFLELSGSGINALLSFNNSLSIKELQIVISAPWAFTITKSVTFDDPESFEVTEETINELITTAKKESKLEKVQGELLEKLGVRLIANTTVHIELNGYYVQNPIGQFCKTIKLSHINALAQEKLIQTTRELQNKILPKVHTFEYSFMYIFYQVLRHLHPNTTEVCLIDITNEATEIGIVRDDILVHATYAPFGLYSLAREIADACNIPREEAYSLLKSGADNANTYGEKNKEKIDSIVYSYTQQVATLFMQTGDTLSIPRTIFLHTSQNTESFFAKIIKQAASKATGGSFKLHLFTSELLGDKTMSDTALALSVYYFHTKDNYLEISMNK